MNLTKEREWPRAGAAWSGQCFAVSLVAAIMLLFAPLAVAAPLDATLHRGVDHRDSEACASCHEQLNHPQLPALFTSDCASCHGGDAAKSSGEFMEMKITPPQEPQKRDLQQGMSLPIYYDKSRLGDAPNKMVLIPAGEFVMGTDNRLSDEGPQHKVKLAAYWIDKYEVTNLQYKKFIDATKRRSPDHFENRTFPDGKADHPVTYVTWNDAHDYCDWAGKRLPTDEEWEKAARGPEGRIFPWGEEFDLNKANTPQRWMYLEHEGDTTPVGAFEAGVSGYGLYDMSGNVWEWTSAWYQPYPGNTHKTENYGEIYKTLKGGSWWDCSFYKCGISAPLYNRSFFLPQTKNKSFGFRCARD
jgi:formylglycine-generating enzyme required for sulfatase activity